MKTNTIHGVIIALNIGFLVAVNIVHVTWLYYLAAAVPLATIAFVLFIKVFRRESMLFQKISTQQALIMLGIMVLFILAGIIHTQMFLNRVIQ
jgi:hypothetical protein